MEFRNLTADDVEVRVQSAKPNGLILLLYKNARVDMNILDATVGPENWTREHYECKGNLYCRVGINVNWKDGGEPRWVHKSDCGVESNTAAEKGEASDSFKRACVNWGIGRELYTSPFIWVTVGKFNYDPDKKACRDKFAVEKIVVENGAITALSIINTSMKTEKGNPVRAFLYQRQ